MTMTPRADRPEDSRRWFAALAQLAADHGLGRGHAMALVHVITSGARISDTHVGSGGTHADPSDTLDGRATNPNR